MDYLLKGLFPFNMNLYHVRLLALLQKITSYFTHVIKSMSGL